MALSKDLEKEVGQIFRERWTTRDGEVVPDSEDVQLGNDAVKLDGTVLYADLAESTRMVDKCPAAFAAEIYKSYLRCAARIIRNEGGEITAYDGDRIMAVFIGNSKNSSAAESALKINYAVLKIINPAIKEAYPQSNFQVEQVVGIDTCQLFVARTGIRGANDLVWVGRAANYAAKLCSLRSNDYPSWITEAVFGRLNKSAKFSTNGDQMWEARSWKAMGGITVYRSNWWRKV